MKILLNFFYQFQYYYYNYSDQFFKGGCWDFLMFASIATMGKGGGLVQYLGHSP